MAMAAAKVNRHAERLWTDELDPKGGSLQSSFRP
jgi:hypothetical protein